MEQKLFYFVIFSTFLSNVQSQTVSHHTEIKEVKEMSLCFTKSSQENLPECNWGSSRVFDSYYSASCVNPGLIRVIGEYEAIRIFCTAPYPLEFDYDGVQPTEAIYPFYGKQFLNHPNGSRMILFTMEVKIYSVSTLFDHFQKTSRNTVQKQIAHSRTGNYSIFGMFNPTLRTSIYQFIEEPNQEPKFLFNSKTKARFNEEETALFLPCRSYHFETRILINSSQNVGDIVFTEVMSNGFLATSKSKNYTGTYTCTLFWNETVSDVLVLMYPGPQYEVKVPYGYEDLPIPPVNQPVNLVYLNFETKTIEGTALIFPRCSNGNQPLPGGDKFNGISTSINGYNEARSRLIKEFISPKYFNESYTVRFGILDDEKNDYLSMPKGFGAGLIASYCQSGDAYKISLSAIGMNAVSQAYPYDQEFLKVTNWLAASVYLFMKLDLLTEASVLYSNTTLVFVCRLHTLGVVWPIVWYSERKNGSLVEEFVDYYDNKKDLGNSYFSLYTTADVNKVHCSSSWWFANEWRNVSVALNLTEGYQPKILNEETIFTFRQSVPNQVLKCIANANPPPIMWWQRDGKNISEPITPPNNILRLEFPSIDESASGIYLCIAQNFYGISEMNITAKIILESRPNYGLFIGLHAVLIFLACLTAIFLLIRFYKSKNNQLGLTSTELKKFFEGQTDQKSPDGSDYVNEFAETCPYDKSMEITQERFQVELDNILGSGAYGVVLRGLLDGQPVAVKTVQKDAEKGYLKALLSELKIMMYIGEHEHLIKLLGAVTKNLKTGIVYVVVPLCPLGSLQNYLREHRNLFVFTFKYQNSMLTGDEQPLCYLDLLNWAAQIAAGMKYLGSKKVIHGDLSRRNLLLDKNKTIKISDFGLSRQLYGYADYVKKNQEPLPWRHMAIESLRYMSFSPMSDVWSYGVSLYELFSLGQVPYEQLEAGLRMSKPKYLLKEDIHSQVFLECWREDPKLRPKFSDLEQRFKMEAEQFAKKVDEENPQL